MKMAKDRTKKGRDHVNSETPEHQGGLLFMAMGSLSSLSTRSLTLSLISIAILTLSYPWLSPSSDAAPQGAGNVTLYAILNLARLFLLWALAASLAFVALAFAVSYILAGVAMRPPWYKPAVPAGPSTATGAPRTASLTKENIPAYWEGVFTDPQTDLGIAYEDVAFPAVDGEKTLRGWFIPAGGDAAVAAGGGKKGAGGAGEASTRHEPPRLAAVGDAERLRRSRLCVVCVHGGGRDRRAFLRHSAFLHAAGFPVLLFDLSEHGTSDGTGLGFTYGIREHRDVIAAVNYAFHRLGEPSEWDPASPRPSSSSSSGSSGSGKGKGGALKSNAGVGARAARVAILSTSLGASSTIIAASLDRRVCGVIAENALTRPERLMQDIFWKGMDYLLPARVSRSLPVRLFGRIFVLVFLIRIGSFDDAEHLFARHETAVQCVGKIAPSPIFFIHGDADRVIPLVHSEKLFQEAREPKELWIVPRSGHCMPYTTHRKEYAQRVVAFLEKLL